MQTSMAGSPAPGVSISLRLASMCGILWNAFGVYQFANSLTDAGRAAMTTGMTSAQALAYLSLPAWVSVVFAIGALGGLIGAIALALNRSIAFPMLAASLFGYGALFIGDTLHRVFDGTPGQVIILAFVVVISSAMLWIAGLAGRRGLLR